MKYHTPLVKRGGPKHHKPDRNSRRATAVACASIEKGSAPCDAKLQPGMATTEAEIVAREAAHPTAPPVVEFRRVSKRYDNGDGPRRRVVHGRPRRVRLPRRLDRIGQVDASCACSSRSSSRPRGRSASPGATWPRSRARRCRTSGATSGSSSRTSSCCPTARCTTTSPTRCRSPAARARRSAPRCRTSCASPACRPSCTTSPTSSPAASSSASRWRARSSTTRRCCWPTSRPATSIPRPRSGSCSCCTASTARARRSSSPRTTRPWSTACAGA